jgi:hypothetical protein
MITVFSFEQKIFNLEGVRVALRFPKHSKLDIDYGYQRKLGDMRTVRELYNRIKKSLGDKVSEIEFVLVDGKGVSKHSPETILNTIRNSYIVKR